MAILSILTLYNYDNTIFDGLQLPTAADITNDADKVASPWVPVKQDLVGELCLECAQLEVMYPDPAIMKEAINLWSKMQFPVWVGLYNTLLYKYNPIWNKDGSYTETRTPGLTTTDTFTATQLKTDHTGNTTNNVTGYDNNTFQPSGQTVFNTADTTNGSTSNTRVEQGSETVTRTETGNIGVTMSQEMIERQREVVKFNLYDVIISDFKDRFCLLLY